MIRESGDYLPYPFGRTLGRLNDQRLVMTAVENISLWEEIQLTFAHVKVKILDKPFR
ncbi:MAG: hypothetical protein ACI8RL_001728 [Cyclobacteriaceae bacterium]|jgi:hypothetical protein